MNDSLVVRGLDLATISATDAARAKRDELITEANYLPDVTSNENAEEAAKLLAAIKNFTCVVEVGRTDAKAPILELGKRVDGLAKELAGDLDAAAVKIARQLGSWQQEQNRKIKEARQRAWQEEQRILREAQEKDRLAREKEREEANARAEASRKAEQEAREKEARARTDAGRAKAQAEAEAARVKAAGEEEAARVRAQVDAERRDEEARNRVVDSRVSAAVGLPAKPAGVSVRKNICFEVTDIVALYEASPALVILSPNNAAIKAVLRGNPGKQLPGIKSWEESAAIIR